MLLCPTALKLVHSSLPFPAVMVVLTGRIVIVLSHVLPRVQPGIANIANRGVARPPVSNC